MTRPVALRNIVATLFAIGLFPLFSSATIYQYANIVDSTGPFVAFPSGPSLNNAGQVVFVAELEDDDGIDGDFGVYRGDASGFEQLAFSDGLSPYRDLSFAQFPLINNRGDVAFYAVSFLKGPGIFTGPDPEADAVANQVDTPFTGFGFFPALNDNGEVLFQASLGGAVAGLYRGSDPVADLYVDNSGPFDQLSTQLDLNNTGGVVFEATLDTGVRGLFTGPDPVGDLLVDDTGPFGMSTPFFSPTFSSPRINDSGDYVFYGQLDSGVTGLFTGPDPATDTLVDDTGPFEVLGGALLNNAGDIIFSALFDGGRVGLFDGTDVDNDRIIGSGDAMFGSTVASINGYRSYNDLGQVAFSYVLDDGTSGIAIATPRLPGDANGDGSVDLLDLDILGANFGETDATFETGDFNEDGVVDLLDLDLLGANFGSSATGPSVPEPTALLLVLVGGVTFVGRR